MKVLKINLKNPDQKIIHQAAQIMKKGGVVVYPTDTCYGLGALAFDKKAIEKVFQIKKRSRSKPLSVVISGIAMAYELAYLDNKTKILLEKFLPGPVTFVLLKRECVPDFLTAGKKTLGIRIPKNKITSQLAWQVKFPYTTTSANLSGESPLYSAYEVVDQFKNLRTKPDLILDAGRLPERLPSTVVDLSVDPPEILRQGTISKEEILQALKKE